MFRNVPIKFFTSGPRNENKVATEVRKERIMTEIVRIAVARSPASFAKDAIGGFALVVILLGGLSLPGFG